MKKIVYAVIVAAFLALAAKVARRSVQGELVQPNITPGAWYCYYLGDYLTEHPKESTVQASVVELQDGSFAWATSTPVWDRDWFAQHGWEFPDKWLHYADLAHTDVEMKEMGA